jgi:hypothetical protein
MESEGLVPAAALATIVSVGPSPHHKDCPCFLYHLIAERAELPSETDSGRHLQCGLGKSTGVERSRPASTSFIGLL